MVIQVFVHILLAYLILLDYCVCRHIFSYEYIKRARQSIVKKLSAFTLTRGMTLSPFAIEVLTHTSSLDTSYV